MTQTKSPDTDIVSRALLRVGFRVYKEDPHQLFPDNIRDIQHRYVVLGPPTSVAYERGEADTVRRLRNGDTSHGYERKLTTTAYSSRLLRRVGPDNLEFRWQEMFNHPDSDGLAAVITVAVGPGKVSDPIAFLTSNINPTDHDVPYRNGIAICDEEQLREFVRAQRSRANF